MRGVVPIFAAICAVALAVGDDADEDVILPAVGDPALPESLMIFIPGGLVPNHHYTPMLKAVQAATTGLRLTVVMPAVYQRLCIIKCAHPKVCSFLKGQLDTLVEKSGFKSVDPTVDTFVAGHSLGATCANNLVQGYDYKYAGLLEMGGYVDLEGAGSLANYSIPVLHMAGELDGGLARPGKLAAYYEQMLAFEKTHSTEEALTRKPVQLLEGLDHSDFCPGFFVTKVKDCKSEVTQDVALKVIGEGASAFLHLNAQKVTAALKTAGMATMKNMLPFTAQLFDPYLKAYEYELGPVCTKAQQVIAGLSPTDSDKLKVADGGCYLVPGDLHDFEHYHTSYTLSNSVLEVKCGATKEAASNFANTGDTVSAKSIDCKMVDATRVAEQLKVTTDVNVSCSDVNVWTVALAESLLSEKSRDRYEKKGRKYCYKPDEGVFENIGPLFIKAELKQTETEKCMEVTSRKLISTIESKIFPGNHYCKLLSPALALDWMMTDSHKPFPYPGSEEGFPTSDVTFSKVTGDACLEATFDSRHGPAFEHVFDMGRESCASRGFGTPASVREVSEPTFGGLKVVTFVATTATFVI